LFDTPPAFGEGMSLRAESTPDICALLLTYLKELPEPVLTPYLFNAFWNWCVRPSVKREDERTRKEQDEEEDLRSRFFQTGQRPPRPSRRILFEKARLRAAQDEAAETGQVAVARDLLRLLPTHSFSLIVYLCAFFTQVPLCPENGITLEDVGRIFGPSVFGGPVPAARRMMVWFLKRWNRVSDGLLDAEPDEAVASSSSSPLPRRDVRVLERADSFELLAPEEEDEDELDFRSTLADPEERHAYHCAKLERACADANATAPLSQSQNWHDSGIVTQEKSILSRPPGWPNESKGKDRERALEPDDSISEAPLWDRQPQSSERYLVLALRACPLYRHPLFRF
jgi:RhoGAP domain